MDEVRGWSRLHGHDVSGNRLAVGWIRLVHLLAKGLLRVPPDALSAAGVVIAAGAVGVAAAGGRWALLACALVVLSGLLDGVDGAVALRTGRARPLGAVVDAVADRLGDVCLVLLLVVLGGPGWLAAAVGGSLFLHEYARARAQGAGMTGAGAITVAERPTRVVIAAVACLGAGLWTGGTPWTGWSWGAVCLVLWAVVAVAGGAHLAVALRRELRDRAAPELAPDLTQGR
ncbi:CDP-diacylglycerol--glycerol-3-phosphate 3-phosphatidyltransferase [Saccharothrix coeruleofusca]|uniref:CDP-alcohol phosphatidyltransferase family protein n=1 Tax=Saccharothrix coeruleofusca TaxID=33919 RepID=UPI0027DE9B18|nr:CDP-alcohol phosphatidyltransferase family protein [Saccharothrix coeruleofusca]MBP2334958.1 CDP-diacylglycerol--glycerol-3-phosphate 3-phosphatidyltransferase [Saccharothrix coeruleofusca]